MPGCRYEIAQITKLKWHKTKSNKKRQTTPPHFFNENIQKDILLRPALWKSHDK